MELTRRELVAAFLGSAVAASACRKTDPREPVPGALVDRVVDTGHRLRAGPLPLAAEAQPVDVLVVGGGVAGLSAAWRLAAAGVKDVRVLELDAEAGGTSRSGKNAVSAYPWGAHYLPAPLVDAGPVMRLLREMDAVTGVDEQGQPTFDETLLVSEPEERIFYRGEWYEGLYLRAGASSKDLEELRRFEARMNAFAAARDGRGRKAFAVPTALSSDDAEWTALDKLSFAHWLEAEGFRSPRLKWLVDYACRDDYGTTAEGVSAWAGIWYFAARQNGQGERSEGFLSWPEGNGRLVHQLLSALPPGQVEPGVLVHRVTPGPDGCRVDAVEAGTGRPRAWRARQVVLACPRFVAAHLVAPWRERRPEWLAAFHYGPWVVANLMLSEAPLSSGFPLSWDNVLYESRSLGYVVATHQRLRRARPDIASPLAASSPSSVPSWSLPQSPRSPSHLLGQEHARFTLEDRVDDKPRHGHLFALSEASGHDANPGGEQVRATLGRFLAPEAGTTAGNAGP